MTRPRTHSFYRWVLHNHSKSNDNNTNRTFEDSPEGDFARDMYSDRKFPKNSHDFFEIITHLNNNSACRKCIDTFRSLFNGYRGYIEEFYPHYRRDARAELMEFLEEYRYDEDGDPDDDYLDELSDKIAWQVTHVRW